MFQTGQKVRCIIREGCRFWWKGSRLAAQPERGGVYTVARVIACLQDGGPDLALELCEFLGFPLHAREFEPLGMSEIATREAAHECV